MTCVIPARQQILEKLDHLTSAQRDLARYVLDHGESVALMTTRQLAGLVNQSDAAVIRFAQAVGYSGFIELRNALREGLLDRVGSSGMRRQRKQIASNSELKSEIFSADAALVDETARLNSDDTVMSVVDLIIAARRIRVVGHGTTYPLAAYLALHLNQCLDKADLFTVGHGDLADRFRSVDPSDLFIGIGYVRYLPYTVDILRLARDAGARVVAITDNAASPLAKLAHHTLYAARGTNSVAWWSQAGTLSLANWLTALVMARDSAGVTTQLHRSDEEWRRLGHWKSDNESSLERRHERSQKSRRAPDGKS